LSDEPFSIAAVADALGDLACRFDLELLDECDSTNARLLTLAGSGAPSGSVLAARTQTAGRGRRGRSWFSAPGDSLTFSLLWRLPPEAPLAGLSLVVGVALARALEDLGITGVSLKWPNDLLLNERKLAGILIELVPGASPPAAVIGIGMNLRPPRGMPSDLRETAAALIDANVPLSATSELLARLLKALHAELTRFEFAGFSSLREAWLDRHAFNGRAVLLLSDFSEALEGICRGVDADGALLLETGAGMQRIISGEVSLRPA
jgi:BirA family transcriptional regulator, biotin operon repressor / biotin---[acetyl-CoA-carboxylase] ligase